MGAGLPTPCNAKRANESSRPIAPKAISTPPASRKNDNPNKAGLSCQREIHHGTKPATKPGATTRKIADPMIAESFSMPSYNQVFRVRTTKKRIRARATRHTQVRATTRRSTSAYRSSIDMYLIHEVELLFLSTLGTEILSLAARCYTPGDVERVDRLFRQSGLMRDKWDRPCWPRRYGERTIPTLSLQAE